MPIGTRKNKSVARLPFEAVLGITPKPFFSSSLHGGMVTHLASDKLQDHQLIFAKNARIRDDKIQRRLGKIQAFGGAPNANKVLRIFDLVTSGGSVYRIRVTRDTVHYYDGATWTALTGTLSGTDSDPVYAALVGDTTLGDVGILANGIDRLKKVNISGGTFDDLGAAAPTAKYVSGMSDRVIAANGGNDPQPSETAYWSGNNNISEFDSGADVSAGNKVLATSPIRSSVDPIKGIFGFTQVGIIPRQKSIWLITPNPVASNPFNFFRAVPGFGVDIPGSIAAVAGGIAFLDARTKNVYVYVPGSSPQPIGDAVKRDILVNIEDPNLIFSGYLSGENEYIIAAKQKSLEVVKLWIYNFNAKAWTYDEIDDVSTFADLDVTIPGTTMDQLQGTVDDLTGTIDSLSTVSLQEVRPHFGMDNGSILVEDDLTNLDFGQSYETDLRTKVFTNDTDTIIINNVRITYDSSIASGSMTVHYSLDEGTTWNTLKTISFELGLGRIATIQKPIRGRRIILRITSSSTNKVKISNLRIEGHAGAN